MNPFSAFELLVGSGRASPWEPCLGTLRDTTHIMQSEGADRPSLYFQQFHRPVIPGVFLDAHVLDKRWGQLLQQWKRPVWARTGTCPSKKIAKTRENSWFGNNEHAWNKQPVTVYIRERSSRWTKAWTKYLKRLRCEHARVYLVHVSISIYLERQYILKLQCMTCRLKK